MWSCTRDDICPCPLVVDTIAFAIENNNSRFLITNDILLCIITVKLLNYLSFK